MSISALARTSGLALCTLLAACAPRLYQRETMTIDHRDLDQFEIRYADFEGCLVKQAVPVSYRLKRPGYVLDLGIHFGTAPQPASLDVTLSGAPDLSARFPALTEPPAITRTEDSARYRVDTTMLGTSLAITVLRNGVLVGEEHLRLEHSKCHALSIE